MAVVDVKVFYLEMLAPCSRAVPVPREGLSVIHARNPTVASYRFLYDTVGKDYHWYSRGKLSDADLAATIQNPLNEVHVLHVEDTPAGLPSWTGARRTTSSLSSSA